MPRSQSNSKLKTQNSKLARLVRCLLSWFSRHARDLPWRRSRDPYAIWVSEIMLQQTQVKTVIPYWERWMRELPTIKALAAARPEKIHKLWEGLGYYTRVRNLQKAAQLIVKNHGGKFPERFEDILALPGIGRYTAGAIGSIAFNQPTPILDGNVIRVLTRIFGIAENPREKKTNARLWQLSEQLVANSKFKIQNSKFSCSHFNQSLMELGALICTPRQPKCAVCPAKRFCVAFAENRVEELPNLGKRAATVRRRFHAFVVKLRGRYLVRQRPAGVVNARLWEFPNVEISPVPDTVPGSADVAASQSGHGANSKPLCTIQHSITRYRITLEAFMADEHSVKTMVNGGGRWLTLSQLNSLSFPSAHKKILAVLADAP